MLFCSNQYRVTSGPSGHPFGRTLGLTGCLGLLISAALPPAPGSAQVLADGYFIATKECPAFQSFQQGTNPGDVHTSVDHAYILRGKNRESASHFLIEVKGVQPSRRWVGVDCGLHVVLSGDTPPVPASPVPPVAATPTAVAPPPVTSPTVPPPTTAPIPSPPPDEAQAGPDTLLAVSWQPAFCELKPAKKECKSMAPDGFEATHFSLHGLWPQPEGKEYCGVSADQRQLDEGRDWERMTPLQLTASTRTALDQVMPGTQSFLERHEWAKHGSCHEDGSPEGFFQDAVRLMEQLNNSPVRTLFAGHIGDRLKMEEIRAAFDAAFGPGTGERVAVQCDADGGRKLITEIRLSLRGPINETASLGALMRAAKPVAPGCMKGIVDPVGKQ